MNRQLIGASLIQPRTDQLFGDLSIYLSYACLCHGGRFGAIFRAQGTATHAVGVYTDWSLCESHLYHSFGDVQQPQGEDLVDKFQAACSRGQKGKRCQLGSSSNTDPSSTDGSDAWCQTVSSLRQALVISPSMDLRRSS